MDIVSTSIAGVTEGYSVLTSRGTALIANKSERSHSDRSLE